MRAQLGIFLIAFLSAFLAELPCLARTAAIAARYDAPRLVVLGTLAGNAALLLPVLYGGSWLAHALPETLTRWVCGLFFLTTGLLILLHRQ